MKARATQGASVESRTNGWLLRIPAGDSSSYRFAQIDDYFGLSRHKFPHHSLDPSTLRHAHRSCRVARRHAGARRQGGALLRMSLRARASSISIPGTWGFGLWNDPFGMSLGFGGNRFQLPALPNAIWFFHASEDNHLSFRDPSTMPVPGVPANGFLAQVFRAPRFHPMLIPAGLALPFSRRTTRKLLGRVIDEDGSALSVDVTQWHRYRLEWSATRSAFWVDEALVFDSPVSPRPPLGVVIWIDNQFASFTPDGRIASGLLDGNEAWLEIEDLEIKNGP